MINLEQRPFSLNNFEGPLDFLVHLVQKSEMDIQEIPIHEITQQYLQLLGDEGPSNVDAGAEFLNYAALLIYLKSKTLLPPDLEEGEDEELEEIDPKLEIINHLIEYCKCREAAKQLSQLEAEQQGAFFRGAGVVNAPLPSGVDHLSTEDLGSLFQDLMKRMESRQEELIHEEEWRVADKVLYLKKQLKQEESLRFTHVFSPDRSRLELIVTFLALLELMKTGVLAVVRDLSTQTVLIIKQTPRPEE